MWARQQQTDFSASQLGSVRFTPYSVYSAYFFSRNSIFLSQQFSQNSILQPVSAKIQQAEWGHYDFGESPHQKLSTIGSCCVKVIISIFACWFQSGLISQPTVFSSHNKPVPAGLISPETNQRTGSQKPGLSQKPCLHENQNMKGCNQQIMEREYMDWIKNCSVETIHWDHNFYM